MLLTLILDDRVQWFKHLAARLRWKEEVEILEEEMRRLVYGLNGMEHAWTTIHFQAEMSGISGRSAFAAAKVDYYKGMLEDARNHFQKLKISHGRYTESQIVSPLYSIPLNLLAHPLSSSSSSVWFFDYFFRSAMIFTFTSVVIFFYSNM